MFGKKMATNTHWQQERLFVKAGPFIHLYTSPLETDLLMEDDEDRTIILNLVALVSRKTGAEVLAYALMNNHIHLVLRADEVLGRILFETLHKRVARYLATRNRAGCMKKVTYGITPITSLKQFRDEVAYVIRNPFVAREDVNLFAYRWCSGYLYFNNFLSQTAGKPAEKLSYRERRTITRSSSEKVPPGFRTVGTLILPESFVNYQLVEQLFVSARQFLYWALKNLEAQIQVASSYGERPFLSDDELFLLSRDLCENMFGTRQPKELTTEQKKEYVMAMRNQYHASNKQLARLTTLSQAEVDEMYPLSARH